MSEQSEEKKEPTVISPLMEIDKTPELGAKRTYQQFQEQHEVETHSLKEYFRSKEDM